MFSLTRNLRLNFLLIGRFYSIESQKKIPFTLIGIKGKRVGEFTSFHELERLCKATGPEYHLVNVNADSNIWKIAQERAEEKENNNNNHSDKDKKIKTEKEFRLSNVITDHDLGVKIKYMESALERGHSVLVVLQQKKKKFSLYQPKHDSAMMDHVRKSLANISKVTIPLKEQSDGSQLMVLHPKHNMQ